MTSADADTKAARKAAKKAAKTAAAAAGEPGDAKRKAAEEVPEAAPAKKQKKDETKEERRARKAEKKARKAAAAAAGPSLDLAPTRLLPPHTRVCAPMVGGSELAFRLLCRRHGADLCYTPMMYSAKFATDAAYRAAELQTCAEDAPLVAHFCGNDPQTLLAAARLAEPHCCAIDLNLGCPQRAASNGHFGAYLCDPADRTLLLDIVSTLSRSLSVPFFCKIRLLDELDDTLAFAQQLQDAGCALLAVHGRYRGSPLRRRDGAAHLDQIALIKQKLSIPVVTNGNVRDAAELVESLLITGADGAMTAEGALDDPAIFGKAIAHARSERARLKAEVKAAKALRAARRDDGRVLTAEETALVKRRKLAKARLKQLPELRPPPPLSSAVPMPPPQHANAAGAAAPAPATAAGGDADAAAPPPPPPPSAPFDLAEQYIALVERHPPPGGDEALLSHAIFHLRRLCRTPLTEFSLLAELRACTSLAACAAVLRRCRAHAEGTLAVAGKKRPPSYWKRQQRRGKVKTEV